MALAQIADKTTLDKIDTDITTLKSRGGFKASSDGFYGYDMANSEWKKVNFGQLSGANPTLIVINKDMTMTGKPVTVSNAFYQKTQVMPNAKFDVFALPTLGNYTVSWTSAGKAKTKVVSVDKLGGIVTQVICYPSFANATWTEISNLLTEAYTNDFDLTDIWDVGNTKSVEFSNIGTLDVKILDFDYDTLTTAIGETTKAKITLATRLPGKRKMADSYMNAGWGSTTLRSYLNSTFYNSMPSGLKALIKAINKSDVSDNCSILSIAEYNGSNNYQYLKDSANISMFNNTWLRDNYYSSYRNFYYITSNYGTSSSIPWMNEDVNVASIFSM